MKIIRQLRRERERERERERMNLGVLPGSSSTALHPRLPTARVGASIWAGRRTGGWLRSASATRCWAAVEEGGIVGMSFYELLGLPEGVGAAEIKRAYKRLALRYHPDVSPPDRAEEYTRHFIEVQEAYETLSDPSRRALYDRHLAYGLHLAFSSRKRFDEELEERAGWKNCWQDQLAGLKRRSANKDSEENLSWGARMRRQRAESSAE